MGRKNLLKGLMDGADPPAASGAAAPGAPPAPDTDKPVRVEPAKPRYTSGAIGAVSQSIAALKNRSVLELDPFMIESAGVQDRLDDEDADHDALVASIRDYGQQVPVLVRPHPDTEGRYQIVFGRRRVKALRELGQPVRALVRSLDDQALMVAQGQENSARKDLSFIEKANFARQMRDLDYSRAVICAALHVDKTVISRMLSVVDRLDQDLIEAIGAAPSVGRDRWLALAELMDRTQSNPQDAMALVNLSAGGDTSDKRFAALTEALSLSERRTNKIKAAEKADRRARPVQMRTPLVTSQGTEFGFVSQEKGTTVVTLPKDTADGFDDWLIRNLSRIHHDWKSGRDE